MNQATVRHTPGMVAGARRSVGGRTGAQRRLAILIAVMVLLAYMPFVGRGDVVSDDMAASRMAEIGLLGLATLGAIALRVRSGFRVPPGPARVLAALITGFSLWAMLSSFKGPLVLTGVAKAVELLALCFISLQLAITANESGEPKPFRTSEVALAGIIVTILVLMAADVVQKGTPVPLSWFSYTAREPRLQLGNNHPLSSALVLAFGILFAVIARMSWLSRIPMLLAAGWLLVLCDARGVAAGCVCGLVILMLRRIPASPYKLLAGIVATLGTALLLVSVLASVNVDQLILVVIGEDGFTLDGRVDLWSYIFAKVYENPIAGVGYYGTRLSILNEFPWAGNAHNSIIEVLFSTGLVGLALLGGFYACWVYALVTTAEPALIGITPVVLFAGMLDPILFTPDVGMFLMLLVLFNAFLTARDRVPAKPASRRRRQGRLDWSRP